MVKDDMKKLYNKFTETQQIVEIAKKYGVKKAGRQTMINTLLPILAKRIKDDVQ